MIENKKSKKKLISDQASAAIVDKLNNQRIHDEAIKLASQDAAFYKALEQVEKVRAFVARPEGILGSLKTKHGEIAEHVEVGIRNSQAIINHEEIKATFEGVGRTDATDYFVEGVSVQSKFINGITNNLNHTLEHMDKYSNFGRDGSYYHIPSDSYETIVRIKEGLPVDGLSEKTKAAILSKIQNIENKSGKTFEDVIKPSSSSYAEVQSNKVSETLDRHEYKLNEKNEELINEIKNDHKPSISDAAKAAVAAAAVGGIVSFSTELYCKHKQGKNPFHGDFSKKDWKDVGITTLKGAGGGAIVGGSVYLLTNNANLSAPFAGAVVSAAKGISSLVIDYNQGNINIDEFIDLGLIICSESAIVGLTTAAGQTLIPIPVLGAVIGSLAGKILSELISGKVNGVADRIRKEMDDYLKTLNHKYQEIIKQINNEFENLRKITEASFDIKINSNLLLASADLAMAHGVSEKIIIKDHSELDDFILGIKEKHKS